MTEQGILYEENGTLHLRDEKGAAVWEMNLDPENSKYALSGFPQSPHAFSGRHQGVFLRTGAAVYHGCSLERDGRAPRRQHHRCPLRAQRTNPAGRFITSPCSTRKASRSGRSRRARGRCSISGSPGTATCFGLFRSIRRASFPFPISPPIKTTARPPAASKTIRRCSSACLSRPIPSLLRARTTSSPTTTSVKNRGRRRFLAGNRSTRASTALPSRSPMRRAARRAPSESVKLFSGGLSETIFYLPQGTLAIAVTQDTLFAYTESAVVEYRLSGELVKQTKLDYTLTGAKQLSDTLAVCWDKDGKSYLMQLK